MGTSLHAEGNKNDSEHFLRVVVVGGGKVVVVKIVVVVVVAVVVVVVILSNQIDYVQYLITFSLDDGNGPMKC